MLVEWEEWEEWEDLVECIKTNSALYLKGKLYFSGLSSNSSNSNNSSGGGSLIYNINQ